MERKNGTGEYIVVDTDHTPVGWWKQFTQVMKRSISLELLKGLKIVFGVWVKDPSHTLQYPKEKLPIGPRYRAVHKLLRLIESGNERCIGCGLCEQICVAKCIRIETHIDENSRKAIGEYSINLGRCIFCGYCAEVCPELAIVHGGRYENASEQRAHYTMRDDMLTPIDLLKEQQEFPGFGAISNDADAKIKKTPLAY